jgi:ribosomal peptide maturation radical SAM protein 1
VRTSSLVRPRLLAETDLAVLLVVPPFFELKYPSLGVHVLQSCAGAAGFRVGVLYANLLFASYVGVGRYQSLAQAPLGTFLGERLFARAAYGVAPLGQRADMMAPERIFGTPGAASVYGSAELGPGMLADLLRIEALVPAWIASLARLIAAHRLPIVGATTTFQQTAPAIALLRAVQRCSPKTLTIIGGANCEGEMGSGVLALAPFLDAVFSGESEETFPAFLSEVARRATPRDRIIYGRPCEDLDSIPPLAYDEYFEQRSRFLSWTDNVKVGPSSMPYETSRGCWWGQKQHCTFCGLNGEGMAFRVKSPDRVLRDLTVLTARHRPDVVVMADNIMPYQYFSSVVPRLARELPGVKIFYEQKANLSREKLGALKRAGIDWIQPGIEALSTDLLKHMRKGTSTRQNISLLRDASGVGVRLAWNLLWGFPNDDAEWYAETLPLMSLLHHLQPPSGLLALGLDRFSPYFDQAESFGVTRLRPYPGYFDFLPPHAPVAKVAYHFTGDYRSGGLESPRLMRKVDLAIERWQQAWAGGVGPELSIHEYAGIFALVDSRGLPDTQAMRPVSALEAHRLLVSEPFIGSRDQQEMIARKVAVHVDGYLVPLAAATDTVFERVEEAAACAYTAGEAEHAYHAAADSRETVRG